MVVFTHPCREGFGVLLLVAEGAGLGLGAGLEPAEESSVAEICCGWLYCTGADSLRE